MGAAHRAWGRSAPTDVAATHRDGGRIIARVDMQFGDLVVEIAGHGTHSSRQQLQADEQRRTELTRLGLRTVAFRYEDVRDRPDWVVAQLRALTAVRRAAA
jgi:very-short-patch-repair endonuclease